MKDITKDELRTFVLDCTIYTLFAGSNHTASIKGVSYKGKLFDIKNHFFPYSKSIVEQTSAPKEVKEDSKNQKETFVFEYLQDKFDNFESSFSKEAKALYEKGKEVYIVFFNNYDILDKEKFKLQGQYDIGWYQIKNSLKDKKIAIDLLKEIANLTDKLKQKLIPKVYKYGFLKDEN